MGRVARYKKIKAIDPFSKKNGGRSISEVTWGLGDDGRKKKKRSYTATELRRKRKKEDASDRGLFDLAPERDDFDIKDMVNSLKKEKFVAPPIADDAKAAAPRTMTKLEVPVSNQFMINSLEDEQRTARVLKIAVEAKPKEETMKRIEGESKKAFYKRVKQETRQLIRQDKLQTQNPEKRQRKKEFMNAKKKAKKGKGSKQTEDSDLDSRAGADDEEHDTFITGEQAARMSTIHDQVERPPSFQQLPRGAVHKKATMAQNNKSSKNFQVLLEHKAMEEMRRKVQAQYALIKSKRKQEGDFHL